MSDMTVGRFVRVLEGYGVGRIAEVVSMRDEAHLAGNVDLVFMDETEQRGNYAPHTIEPVGLTAVVAEARASLTSQIDDLRGQVRAVRVELNNARAEHERRIEHITEVAHRWGTDKGFCSDFDDILEEAGLERRDPHKWYDVTITVSVDVTVPIWAEDASDARSIATENETSYTMENGEEYEGLDRHVIEAVEAGGYGRTVYNTVEQ